MKKHKGFRMLVKIISLFVFYVVSVFTISTLSTAKADDSKGNCSYCDDQDKLKKRFLEVNQEKAKEINRGFTVLEKMLSEYGGKRQQTDAIVEWIGTLLEEGDELYISAEKAFGAYEAHRAVFEKSIQAQPPFLKERIIKAFKTVAKVKKHGNG